MSVESRSGWLMVFFFFFQAEDGIRDLTVTGVQTCALPISALAPQAPTAFGTDILRHLDAQIASARRLLEDRKSTRLNSSHSQISYAVFCLKKNNQDTTPARSSYHSRAPRLARRLC